jgi:hypothetical protein
MNTVQGKSEDEATRFLGVHAQRAPCGMWGRFRIRVCGARGDTRAGDESGYPPAWAGLSLSDTIPVLTGLGVDSGSSEFHHV